MTRAADRRSFIRTVVAGAAVASLARLRPALAAPGGAPAQQLSDNLWLFVSGGANVVACRDAAGVARCSTPGIACQARDIACESRGP